MYKNIDYYRQLIAAGENSSSSKKRKLNECENSPNARKVKIEDVPVYDKPAMKEELQGIIDMKVLTNDGSSSNLLLLTGLKNLIKIQLPNMPPEYITRLVYDK